MRVFGKFFFPFGRFRGTIDHLPIVPTGKRPSFVKESNIISPSWLYRNFNYGDMRGLVSMHFLVAINIYFGGNVALSKYVLSEFFHNLSMQTLNISDDSIVLKFDALKGLNKNVNDLIDTNIHMQKKGAVISKIQNLDPPTIVGDKPTINNKIESIIVKEILNDGKPTTVVGYDIPLAKVAEKIAPEIDKFGEDLQKLFQENICSDYKPAFNNVIGINDWENKIKEDQEMREPKLEKHSKFSMQTRMLRFENAMQIFSLKCSLATNSRIDNLEKNKELQDEQNKQSAAKIEPKLDAYLRDENDKTFFDDENVSRTQHPSPSKKYYTMYAKNTKLHKSKSIASRKKKSKNDNIE